MNTYAIVKQEVVASLFFSEDRAPFELFFGKSNDYIEITPQTGLPTIGLQYKKGKFQPSPTAKWDDKAWQWKDENN